MTFYTSLGSFQPEFCTMVSLGLFGSMNTFLDSVSVI
jgi:hypothetical protein